jgi:hypothetical protein
VVGAVCAVLGVTFGCRMVGAGYTYVKPSAMKPNILLQDFEDFGLRQRRKERFG